MDTYVLDLLILCLKEKHWTEYRNLFSPYDFKNNDNIILSYFKNEWNKLNWTNKIIIGIENYFYQEINQTKSYSKKLNKYVIAFDCIDKVLIVLSATSSWVSIISFTSIVGAPIVIGCFTLIFSKTTKIVKKLLNITWNKKKKYDKTLMRAKSKLNSIETLISQALIDMEISHKGFITILKEKDKYERMKENLRSENEKYKSKKLWDWVV